VLWLVHIHPTADVSPHARVGSGSYIWNQAQVREEARIGCNCIIGKNVYVDWGVVISDGVKVQNNVSIYHGVLIEDRVFIGPHVCFTNDVLPRAMTHEGSIKERVTGVSATSSYVEAPQSGQDPSFCQTSPLARSPSLGLASSSHTLFLLTRSCMATPRGTMDTCVVVDNSWPWW